MTIQQLQPPYAPVWPRMLRFVVKISSKKKREPAILQVNFFLISIVSLKSHKILNVEFRSSEYRFFLSTQSQVDSQLATWIRNIWCNSP